MRFSLIALVVLFAACPPSDSGTDGGGVAPTVDALAPAAGPVTGGTLVTISGSNFSNDATVKFGSQAGVQVVVLSKLQLTVKTPVFTKAGAVPVTVTNPDGKSGTRANAFTAQEVAPKVIEEALLSNAASVNDSSGSSMVRAVVVAAVQVANGTKGAGVGPGVLAKVGFATTVSATPLDDTEFTWVDASYTGDTDGPTPGDQLRDTYSGDLSLPGAGGAAVDYYLAAKFSTDNGTTWKIADRDGAANGSTKDQLAVVHVTKPSVDWCKLGGENIESPPSLTVRVGGAPIVIVGQVYKAEVTTQSNPGMGITGELGYGAAGADPSKWTWIAASYDKKTGNGSNEEWHATLAVPAIGTYKYAFRFTQNGGAWAYCDADGLAKDGFTETQSGTLTVTAPVEGVEWCKLGGETVESPPSLSLATGEAGPLLFGQVYKDGVTNVSTPSTTLQGQLGYGAPGSNPSTWTWVNAAYSKKSGGNGANEEWQATLPNPGIGTYKFAYRFTQNAGTWKYCDANGLAVEDFTEAQAGTLTVTAPVLGVEWCKLGGEAVEAPPSVTLIGSAAGPLVFGQVYKNGTTTTTTPSTTITGQIGYGAAGSMPETWTWVNATYNKKTGGGSNEEWQATLPNPGIGTYKYAYRFTQGTEPYKYCDADGFAVNGFTEAQAGTLIVAPISVGSCNLQFPFTLDSVEGRETATVYGQMFVAGITDGVGQGTGLQVELGYGPTGQQPSDAGWHWQTAAYNVDVGSGAGDEYQAKFTGPAAGTYGYAYRTRAGTTAAWTYCDRDGSGNGYDPAQGGVMTARAFAIDQCVLEAASTFSVLPSVSVGPVRATVRVPTLTEATGAGAGIVGELGYGAVGAAPSTWTTWTAAAFDTDSGDFDQYRASLTAPSVDGAYELAYRFKLGTGAYVYCDKDGATYSSAQAGRLTVTAKQISYCKLETVSSFDIKSGDPLSASVSVEATGSTAAGATPGLIVQVGVGPRDNASTSAAWGWATATYASETAGRELYATTVQPAYNADRSVAGRASIDNGATWKYCDFASTDGGFDPAGQYNVVVREHTDIPYCTLQSPATVSLAAGTTTVYGQIYDPAFTPNPAAALKVEFGTGIEAADPGVAWTWKPAVFNVVSGNNNEYQFNYTPDGGAPNYAFRFSKNDGGTWCYGDRDGNGGGTAGFSGLNDNLGKVVP